MNNAVKIGIAGCGWIAEYAYFPALLKNKKIKITAVFDVDSVRAKNLAEKIKDAEVYKDYSTFLQSDISAVIICTPNASHKELTVKALRQGKHVLCEKPVALNMGEMEAIKEAKEQSGKVYVPGFVNRYREDVYKLKNILTAGTIGVVKRVEGYWIREKGIPRPGTWFTEKKLSGGGALIDLGSHIIDICLLLGGSVALRQVKGEPIFRYDYDDTTAAEWFEREEESNFAVTVESSAKAKFELVNKVEVLTEVSWNTSKQKDYTRFVVYGTKGSVELNTLFGFSTQRRWEKPYIRVVPDEKQEYIMELDWFDLQPVLPFEKLCDYFVQLIEGRSEELGIEDGIRAVQTIDFIYQGEKLYD